MQRVSRRHRRLNAAARAARLKFILTYEKRWERLFYGMGDVGFALSADTNAMQELAIRLLEQAVLLGAGQGYAASGVGESHATS